MEDTLKCELLVVGAGMAGHTAAGYAAARGARVVVLEKAEQTGGSALLSGGNLWTAPTLEVLRDMVPDGDPVLGRHLVETYPAAADWVRSTGTLGPPHLHGNGRGYKFDVLAYFQRCEALVNTAGGFILRRTAPHRLLVRRGVVTGAVVRTSEGEIEMTAAATTIATGGFQASRPLLREWFGENADRFLVRSNPCSTGDGITLGREAGAAVAGDMQAFFGHLMASPIVDPTPAHFSRLLVWYSSDGIVVNTAGERFTDESLGDFQTAQALARQPLARGAVVLDEMLVQNLERRNVRITTCLQQARDAGGRTASASTLDELGRAISAWGFNGGRMVATVCGYNDQLRGNDLSPSVRRRSARHLLMDPPFYAQEVQVGITFTHGGLRVDAAAQVLTEDGTPLPGLLAAGADVGGVYNGGYAGGLSLACVFGITAARTALDWRT